jgi:hypothetical protein
MISGRLEEYVSYVRLSELANIAPARLAGAVRIRELTVSVCKKRCVLPLCESSGTLSSSSYPGSDGMGVHWSEAIFGEWDKGEDKKNRRRSSSSFETFPPPFDDPLGRTGICEQAMARMTFCPQQRRLANTSSRCTQRRSRSRKQEAGIRCHRVRQAGSARRPFSGKKVFCGKETWCLSRSACVVANAAWRLGLTGHPAAQLAQCFTRKSNADHWFKRCCESRFSSAHEGVVTQRRDWDFPRI